MKTKLFKRLGATVLALGIALSVMAIPTSALSNTDTGTITVNGLDVGDTVTIYQLTTVNYNNDADQPEAPVHNWVSTADTDDIDVAAWVNTNYSTYIVAGTTNVNINNFKATNAAADQVAYAPFYAALKAEVENGESTLNLDPAQTAQTVREGETSVTFNQVNMGLYLIVSESATVGASYNANAVYVGPTWDEKANDEEGGWVISNYPTTVNAKGSMTPPPPTKTPDTTADNGVQIGDDVEYTITYALANLQYPDDATNKTFIIGDTLSNELTLKTPDPAIKAYGVPAAGDDVELTATTDYTLTIQNNSFSVNFVYDNVKTYTSVKIVYTATVNENAFVSEIDNSVSLTYNPNPYDDEKFDTGTTTTVYSYGIEMTKTASDKTTTLPGAQFKLQKQVNGEYEDVAIETYTAGDGSNHYRVDPDGSTYIMTTDTNGKIFIEGLEEGNYQLVETKAPDGYVLPSNPVTAVVISGEKGNANGSTFGTETIIDDDMYVEGIVTNISEDEGAPSLPTTGGMGTILFTTVGLVLVGGAAILLVVMYKRKKEN